METIQAEDLILLEEKEPTTSKEIFKEYRKKKKNLKEIAKEKGISYNTAKQYSSTYKYKQRLELSIELETNQIAERKKQLIKEHEDELNEALNKSYDVLTYAVRNTKGAEMVNLEGVQSRGVIFEDDEDYKAFNNWSKSALTNMNVVNETLKAIEQIENKLILLD